MRLMPCLMSVPLSTIKAFWVVIVRRLRGPRNSANIAPPPAALFHEQGLRPWVLRGITGRTTGAVRRASSGAPPHGPGTSAF